MKPVNAGTITVSSVTGGRKITQEDYDPGVKFDGPYCLVCFGKGDDHHKVQIGEYVVRCPLEKDQ